MGNHQHRPGKFLQGHGQGQAHLQVEVVGRLVEQQQVGLLPGDQRQGQASLLATGKVQHRLVYPRAAEVEAAKEVLEGLLALAGGDTLQMQQRAGLRIERVELMLGEVADRQVLAAQQASTQFGQVASQGLDQGRLAGAVGAEQTDARAGHQLQLDLLQHRLVAIAEAAVAEIQQRPGNLVRLAEAEVERRIDVGRRQFLEALQRLDPALRLARLGGLGLEAGDEALHVRALRLLLLVGLLLLRQALGTGPLEGGIAAPIKSQLAVLEVHHVVHHRIEEVAVVGDQHEGARIALEPVLQPEDRVEVEVVGRLVEQQQVGRAHQRLRQVQAHPPATGEVADAALHLLAAEAQAGEQLSRPRIGGIAVGVVQLGVQACLGGAVVRRFCGGQGRLDFAQAEVTVEHIVHGQALEGIDLLAHVRDAPVGRQLAIAGVLAELATQQGEQAGLASAIGPDQAGLLAGMQGQFGSFQEALRPAL
ncbi:large tegument protein [Pseudomonas paraeruginosa]|nr:large tegument protein [Pseudomonas aeruginosa]